MVSAPSCAVALVASMVADDAAWESRFAGAEGATSPEPLRHQDHSVRPLWRDRPDRRGRRHRTVAAPRRLWSVAHDDLPLRTRAGEPVRVAAYRARRE